MLPYSSSLFCPCWWPFGNCSWDWNYFMSLSLQWVTLLYFYHWQIKFFCPAAVIRTLSFLLVKGDFINGWRLVCYLHLSHIGIKYLLLFPLCLLHKCPVVKVGRTEDCEMSVREARANWGLSWGVSKKLDNDLLCGLHQPHHHLVEKSFWLWNKKITITFGNYVLFMNSFEKILFLKKCEM